MGNIKIFFKHQLGYFVVLLLVFALPLALFFKFSKYPVPGIEFAVLAILFVSQYVFYKAKAYRDRVIDNVTDVLKKDLGRMPSRNQIEGRMSKVVYMRGLSIILTGLVIFVIMAMR